MSLDDAQRPSRKPPETRRRKAREPDAPLESPPPETYQGDPRAWYQVAAVQRRANLAVWRAMQAQDPRISLEAAKAVQERAWGKTKVADAEPGKPVEVSGDLGQAQDALERLLATMVRELEQRISRGYTGGALVKEAREAAELLEQLLARRRDAAKVAGLEGASAADLVAHLAEQMSGADLAALQERLVQVAEAKEAMQ